MTDANSDRLMQQLAKDVRFLAYQHGKPTPPVLLFFCLILGIVLLVGAAAFVAEISVWISGGIDENRPHTHKIALE